MLWMLGTAAWACSCIGAGSMADQIAQADYGFQGRVVALEPIPQDGQPQSGFGPVGPLTRVRLAVRHVYKGEVPETVFPTLAGGLLADGMMMGSSCDPSLLVGDEIIVASDTLTPALNVCSGHRVVQPGQVSEDLGAPLVTYDLAPGPKEAFVDALSRCDAAGIRAGLEARLHIPIEPVAKCNADTIALFMENADPFQRMMPKLPPGVVENSATADVLALVKRFPDAASDAQFRAIAAGRVDIVASLADRQEPSFGMPFAPTPEVVALLLELDDDASPALLKQGLEQCFREVVPNRRGRESGVGVPREQRHQAARLLIAAGAPTADPPGSHLSVLPAAVMDDFPDAEVLGLIDSVAEEDRAAAARQALLTAARVGRTELFDTLWGRYPHPEKRSSVAREACAHESATLTHVLATMGEDESALGCWCAFSAVRAQSTEILERVTSKPAAADESVCWERVWSEAERVRNPQILEILQATRPR